MEINKLEQLEILLADLRKAYMDTFVGERYLEKLKGREALKGNSAAVSNFHKELSKVIANRQRLDDINDIVQELIKEE